jgi:hypothetical protein
MPKTKELKFETDKVLNFYKCLCGCMWVDLWDCGCDDRCPGCGADVGPFETQEVKPTVPVPNNEDDDEAP